MSENTGKIIVIEIYLSIVSGLEIYLSIVSGFEACSYAEIYLQHSDFSLSLTMKLMSKLKPGSCITLGINLLVSFYW